MPRLLFEKTGTAVWISHLDLMRLFQRAFKRAGLPLTHTQGFSPRPAVSIALPLSVGIESRCELLDFELTGQNVPNPEIMLRLNEALVEGVKVLAVYDDGAKLKNLALLRCELTLEYGDKISDTAAKRIAELFRQKEVTVTRKSKNGPVEQNIIPMIRSLTVEPVENTIRMEGLICCQNPTLNPMLLSAAVEKYLPDLKPDHVRCIRLEIYDTNETVFR